MEKRRRSNACKTRTTIVDRIGKGKASTAAVLPEWWKREKERVRQIERDRERKDDERIIYDGREFSSIFLAPKDERLSVNALLCLHMFTRCFIYYFQSVIYFFLFSRKIEFSVFVFCGRRCEIDMMGYRSVLFYYFSLELYGSLAKRVLNNRTI